MSNAKDQDKVWSEEHLLAKLAVTLPQIAPDSQATVRMRVRLMDRVQQSGNDFYTCRADEGTWCWVSPGIEKKQLKVDHVGRIESFLLRVQPGAEAPPHLHEGNEHCFVLQGEINFGDTQLRVGDYHYAKKGSRHPRAWCDSGALLFMQVELAGA